MLKKLVAILFIAISFTNYAQTGWQTVTGFGANPGNLNMYSYVPTGISGSAPLVVVMHGCTQTATMVAVQSGWNTLADRHKFFVVYPEQNSANNSSSCFNWFLTGDQSRNQGEAGSIKQMVDYMKVHYNIDTTQIFATGLSAGACMTTVMLACYPDVFKAGAVMAGAPYKAASNSTQALNIVYGTDTNTPIAWGDSVRNEFSYAGAYPKVAVFQGSADPVVNVANENEIMKQWTNVHGADQTADATVTSFNGNPYVTKNTYNDNSGNEVVETYTLSGMGHAIALDTGNCYQKCGQTGTYALEVYFSSTFWAAYFFNILNNNAISVNGLQTVSVNQTSVTYSVTNIASTTYTWTVPAGATITSGQGTNQITVNFGTTSGNVSVTETSSLCKVGPFNLYVNVGSTTGINANTENGIKIYPNPSNGILNINSQKNIKTIKVLNLLGEVVYSKETNDKENSINLKHLPTGIYFIFIQDEDNSFISKKIILQ
ncbi:MAG: PHB depolymerase family esterase [Bacteroidia bacterium]